MPKRSNAHLAHRLLVGAACAVLAVLGIVAPPGAQANSPGLPLGDADLVETRTSETIAPGVSLLSISRGESPTTEDQIATTSRGPWEVRVLIIDPASATGDLTATYGTDLASTQTTSEMAQTAGALAGVNASFFHLGATFPGDPRGLGMYGGRLLSEPTTTAAETDVVLNTQTEQVLFGPLRWAGQIRNTKSGSVLKLEYLDHPPVVPQSCAALVDQTACSAAGDVVMFHPEFARTTPAGYGVEVVLNAQGCVVRRSTTRGTSLVPGEVAIQATGTETNALLRVTKAGCLTTKSTLSDPSGKQLQVTTAMYGVNGRYRLVANGATQTLTGSDAMFDRNPRTIIGTTVDGTIMLVTIDGRQVTSVGATLAEAAAVARALGMHDAVNLDGGGSTTMTLRGQLVNQPSGAHGERPVGDALIYLP